MKHFLVNIRKATKIVAWTDGKEGINDVANLPQNDFSFICSAYRSVQLSTDKVDNVWYEIDFAKSDQTVFGTHPYCVVIDANKDTDVQTIELFEEQAKLLLANKGDLKICDFTKDFKA